MSAVTITLVAPESEVSHTATGDTFAAAAVALVTELLACYEDIIPAVFEGLAELADDCPSYTHSDFSMPEENFTMEVKR